MKQKAVWNKKPSGAAVRSALIAAAFAVLGGALLQPSKAATFSVSKEAEGGTIAGSASEVINLTASAGAAVRFGVTTGPPSTPSGLQTFTGGTSIALRWNGSTARGTAAIKQYDIYRNGSKVASVTPGFHADFPEVNGNGYIDSLVTAGQSYSYQVMAVDTAGQSSVLSPAVSATHPAANTTAKVTVNVDSSATPALAAYMNNTLAPYLRTWYPKIADFYDNGAYDLPDVTINIVGNATATADTPTYDHDVATYVVSPADHATTAQNQDLLLATQFMSTYSLRSITSTASWVASSMEIYPYYYLVRAMEPPDPTSIDSHWTFARGAGAVFLNWISTRYQPDLVQQIALSKQRVAYSNSIFFKTTGKTQDQLWTQMTGQKVSTSGLLQLTGANKCLFGNTADTPLVELRDCLGYNGQNVKQIFNDDGSAFQLLYNNFYCIYPQDRATNDGAIMTGERCGPSNTSQFWKMGPNNSLINVTANKCLQSVSKAADTGTKLELRPCDNSSAQSWTLPSDTAPVPAPTGLRAYTGGNNIAVQWDMSAAAPFILEYKVFRNGQDLGVNIRNHAIGYRQYGTTYIDKNVTPGATYTYQVQAIDSNGKVSPLSTSLNATHPSSGYGVPEVSIDASFSRYSPDLLPWVQTVAVPEIETWYPKAASLYVNGSYTPVSSIVIKTQSLADFEATIGPGIYAYVNAASNAMVLNPEAALNDFSFASGTVVHESMHILQYAATRSTSPSWFTEGIAEYLTNYIQNNLPDPSNKPVVPNEAGDSGTSRYAITPRMPYVSNVYSTGSFFINHLAKKYGIGYLRSLTTANHFDTTTTAMMQLSDGKTTDQAFGEATGFGSKVGPIRGNASGRCIESDPAGGMRNNTAIRINTCTNGMLQKMGTPPLADDFILLVLHGKCLGVSNGATANGTAVLLQNCINGNAANPTAFKQHWKISNGTLVSQLAPNKCLQPANAGTAAGTTLQIFDCNGSAAQRWVTP